jgi:hypothetical protein
MEGIDLTAVPSGEGEIKYQRIVGDQIVGDIIFLHVVDYLAAKDPNMVRKLFEDIEKVCRPAVICCSIFYRKAKNFMYDEDSKVSKLAGWIKSDEDEKEIYEKLKLPLGSLLIAKRG